MADLEKELETAIRAATSAGEIIRGYYRDGVEVRQKGKDNPVTDADLEANRRIHDVLMQAFPADGWLSEETADSPERLSRPRVWIVDPLDGTKEFIQGIPEFCVCIALAVDGEARLGVSYNPVHDELFSGVVGQGAQLNGVAVRVSETADLHQARVLASRSEDKRGEWDAYKSRLQVVLTGSVAYKLALISAGRGDATFSLTPKNEWDICAGVALITAAGGRVTDSSSGPLRFNKPKTKLPGLIASNGLLHGPIEDLLRETRS